MIEKGCFGRALQIVASDPITYVAGGIVLQIVSLAAGGLLTGPAICGIVWITLKHCRGEEVSFGDLFKGYENLGATLPAGIVFVLMVGAGLAFLVVPGLILGALFCFAFPLAVDRNLTFSEAMAASCALGRPEHDLLDLGFLFLLALLTGLSGVLLCGVGLLFTWPLMWAILAVAYEDLARAKPAAAAS